MHLDNFRATPVYIRGHNPAYKMYGVPPLLYLDPSVLSLLPNDAVCHCVATT